MLKRSTPDFGEGMKNLSANNGASLTFNDGLNTGATSIAASSVHKSPFNEGLDSADIEDYVRSMKESGLIEPITVYKLPGGAETGYEILSGHQRFEAWCGRLGNRSIKAYIIPYEEDPVRRFKAHSDANMLHRDKNINFWLSRIRLAKQVVIESGFEGKKAELMTEVSKLLGGMSTQQLYRYESFEKLIPELQAFEKDHILSASTLYAAVSLSEDDQRKVKEQVDELLDVKKRSLGSAVDDAEITREEFRRIVSSVKEGAEKKNKAPAPPATYDVRAGKAVTSVIGTLKKCRTPEEKESARQRIAELRTMLDELEASLGADIK